MRSRPGSTPSRRAAQKLRDEAKTAGFDPGRARPRGAAQAGRGATMRSSLPARSCARSYSVDPDPAARRQARGAGVGLGDQARDHDRHDRRGLHADRAGDHDGVRAVESAEGAVRPRPAARAARGAQEAPDDRRAAAVRLLGRQDRGLAAAGPARRVRLLHARDRRCGPATIAATSTRSSSRRWPATASTPAAPGAAPSPTRCTSSW